MKPLKRIKLNALSQSGLKENESIHLYGGNYCHFDDYNRDANNEKDVCSCTCPFSHDYYGATGINHEAAFMKRTTSY